MYVGIYLHNYVLHLPPMKPRSRGARASKRASERVRESVRECEGVSAVSCQKQHCFRAPKESLLGEEETVEERRRLWRKEGEGGEKTTQERRRRRNL